MAVTPSAPFTQYNYQWTAWKVVQAAKNLVYQYNYDGTIYTIYGYDGFEVHIANIWSGIVPPAIVAAGYSQTQNNTDLTDFTTSWEAGANKEIEQGTGITNAFYTTITDDTHGPVAVKAASTAAVAADPSLVVALSPNSLLPLPTLETTVRFSSAAVSVSSSGNNTLVAGVTAQTVRVFRLMLVFSTATTVQFQDGASTALTGAMSLNAGATITLDFESEPWFITSAGNAFVMNLGTAGSVTGIVYYTQS